ncbi:unnamed protein product [Caenorhabditis bovis]|uniref:Core Histone H2A/H2B/H3 domain-containing protein n=1 Tax=Caenorhabditis bovis TaxID=2654633 RepID=A0A8S1EMV3_9PELO|nr:unnamed protein product [Caenorhabditis bovis]
MSKNMKKKETYTAIRSFPFFAFTDQPEKPATSCPDQESEKIPKVCSSTAPPKSNRRKKCVVKRGYREKFIDDFRRTMNSTNLEIPKEPMKRLILEILHDINPELHIKANAVDQLHQLAEEYMTFEFAILGLLAFHGKRETLMLADVNMWNSIKTLIESRIDAKL